MLFEIVNGVIPCDWKCNFFTQNEDAQICTVFGPEFISQSEDAYQAMVELDAAQVDLFWKRIDALSLREDS
jgi:hypothetical protein